jgi:hypothetical protein
MLDRPEHRGDAGLSKVHFAEMASSDRDDLEVVVVEMEKMHGNPPVNRMLDRRPINHREMETIKSDAMCNCHMNCVKIKEEK